MKFRHLEENNQTYNEHFKDSFKYFKLSLKSSFYFLCHAIYPDLFVDKGSKTIFKLSKIIQSKYGM